MRHDTAPPSHGLLPLRPARRPAVMLAAAGLAAGAVAEGATRLFGLAGAAYLPAVLLLYAGLWVALLGAVGRLSGPPLTWYTVAVPVVGAVLAAGLELYASLVPDGADGGTLVLVVLLAAVIVPVAGGIARRRPWKAGLVAVSLLGFHAAVSLGALSGLVFGTFGATRSDEALYLGAIPAFAAILVAAVAAPRVPWKLRLTGPALTVAAVAAALFSDSDGGLATLAGLLAAAGTVGIVDTLGRARSDTTEAVCAASAIES